MVIYIFALVPTAFHPLAYQRICLLAFLLALGACESPPEPSEAAFYYWKSRMEISPAEQAVLDSLRVRRLYVKYLDVDVEGGRAVPNAGIRWGGEAWKDYEIVPCVFISNRTFLEATAPGPLAERVWGYLQQANEEAGLQPREYQFDCDWSPSTRAAYFTFLHSMRQWVGDARLSATIRLHQYRYPEQTGVPPVDKGSLMYYNMGNIEDVRESNSILNNETAADYLKGAAAYELPLDVALPLFSWVLVYRLGELHRIINWTDAAALDEKPAFEKRAANRYRVQQNTYFAGHYLNQGDVLRYESASQAELQRAARQLQSIEHFSGTTLYYHLDEALLQNYPPAFLRRVARTLHGR